ncbi:MAG TPA: pyridoxal-dependent decarboxylase [Jatrophihabitans sp.]|nr:pyridoxal-dependent decarboxylase [Jatrophihabitans sp.]
MDRLADRGVDGRAARAELASTELPPIDSTGIGTAAAWTLLRDRVLATAQPTDHPRYLAFVAGAASVSAVLADMAVSAAGVYAGSELEAGAVVAAERAALGWLAKLIGMPDTAHGAFVSGGTIANLSALVVARHAAARRHGRQPNVILCGASAHSSVRAAAVVMGCSVISVGDPDHPMSAADLRAAFAGLDPRDVAGVVATAGATNTGAIDDLTGIAGVCSEFGAWLHVDAAYGGAALLAPRTWPAFAGINAADSVTIDPHKWLFTPFDCGAVLYRDPALARDVHAQTAPYLDVVSGVDQDNPADYAVHLSRRARGLPLWMSLIAHGTEAYEQAVDTCLDLAEHAAARVRDYPELRLVGEPSLSVVLLERLGWTDADYARWSESARRRGLGLITPTSARGRAALRFCFVNPQTTKADVDLILQDLARSTCEVEPDLRKCSTVPIG